jgi:DNA polymerase elongation subunit (family B)
MGERMPIRKGIQISEEDAVAYDHHIMMSEYYDKLQYVFKIKLNSLYGALSNPFFRFYDLRNGESTTGTGRAILKHQCAVVNEAMTGIYDMYGEAILAGDTDSTYFLTYEEGDQAIKVADAVADVVNKSFQPFMKEWFLCTAGYDNRIKSGRELVASAGIFVEKKRYMLHVVDEEGKKVDKEKIMGLDLKKTIIPKEISKILSTYIRRLLMGEDWKEISKDIVQYKEELLTTDKVYKIGLPKGIGKMQEYLEKYNINPTTFLPGHVAASINWNRNLKERNDKTTMAINGGMKIRTFYLKKPEGRFKSIAIPTDIDFLPEWFVTDYVPNIDRKAQIKRLIDNPLENIIKALGWKSPTKKTLLMDQFLDFGD